jgi:hypothetical protein
MSALTEWVEMRDRQICEALTAIAPPCPECGGKLVGKNLERQDYVRDGDDLLTCSLEVWRCESCGKQIMRSFELDRITAEERERGIENAVKRAELRRDLRKRYGVLGMFKKVERGIEAEVQRQFPHRPEPDLMERYRQEIVAASSTTEER